MLGAHARKIHLRHFPDGESLVRVDDSDSANAMVLHSLDHPDTKLMPTLLAADALRRAGVRNVTLIAPYLPYMRQDKIFASGEPISQRVMGDVLGTFFDRVLCVEAHLHRIRDLGEVVPSRLKSRSLSAAPAIAKWLCGRGVECLIVGPDRESQPWVEAIAKASGHDFMVGDKKRKGDRTVSVNLGGMPNYRRALIVDDIASSGVTLAATAQALRARGIRTIEAVVVHAIFAAGALSIIREAGIRRLFSCDTIAHRTNAISVASIIAEALT